MASCTTRTATASPARRSGCTTPRRTRRRATARARSRSRSTRPWPTASTSSPTRASNTLVHAGNNLASGIKYYAAVCNLSIAPQYWPARYIDHKLANKEFDEEDFYVSGPTHIAFGGQPSNARVGRSIGTVTVMALDSFNSVSTADNSDSVTLTISGGSLSWNRDQDVRERRRLIHEPDGQPDGDVHPDGDEQRRIGYDRQQPVHDLAVAAAPLGTEPRRGSPRRGFPCPAGGVRLWSAPAPVGRSRPRRERRRSRSRR